MKPTSYLPLRPSAFPWAAVCFALSFLSLATAAQAIRFGPPRPVCEEVQRLEGVLHIEVIGEDTGGPEYKPIDSGRCQPILLIEGRVYRFGLRMGQGPQAPVIPARYRLEHGSFLALSAYGVGEDAFPIGDLYSINTHDQIQVFARNPGRRNLYLRVSECWTGGGRYLHAPAETLIPVIVLREEEAAP